MLKVAELSTWSKYFRWEFPKFTNWIPDIEAWIKDREYVHDCDNCGDETSYFVVMENGEAKFYKLYHNWYWDGYGTGESQLINDFEFTECSRDEIAGSDAKKNLGFVV